MHVTLNIPTILAIISILGNGAIGYLYQQEKLTFLQYTITERAENDKRYALIASVDDIKSDIIEIKNSLQKLLELIISKGLKL
jgi:hypothetical protein